MRLQMKIFDSKFKYSNNTHTRCKALQVVTRDDFPFQDVMVLGRDFFDPLPY